MKTLFVSIGLLGLSSCIKLQGYITSAPGLPIKGISLPDKAVYMAAAAQPSYIAQPQPTFITQPIQHPTFTSLPFPQTTYIQNPQYTNPISYIPQMPSIDFNQSLLKISGVQNYHNNVATTNDQNVVVNTSANSGSNSNTNLNNNAFSTSNNSGTVA